MSRLMTAAAWATRLVVLVMAANAAYHIRMYAIEGFGRVIHEFDPWFNFRATQYLADNGWDAFFHWFDRMRCVSFPRRRHVAPRRAPACPHGGS